MRETVSTQYFRPAWTAPAQTRAAALWAGGSTVGAVRAQGVAHRQRLIYWIREGMRRREIRSDAAFAVAIGVPKSTVNRWLDPQEKAVPSILSLGVICRALRLDPMLFAMLPPIPRPADPLAIFDLEGTDAVTVTDAARLALLGPMEGEEDDPPAEGAPPEPLDTRRRRGAPRCPRVRPDQ